MGKIKQRDFYLKVENYKKFRVSYHKLIEYLMDARNQLRTNGYPFVEVAMDKELYNSLESNTQYFLEEHFNLRYQDLYDSTYFALYGSNVFRGKLISVMVILMNRTWDVEY